MDCSHNELDTNAVGIIAQEMMLRQSSGAKCTPKDQGNLSSDSAYSSPDSSLSLKQTRNSTWIKSLQSLLHKYAPQYVMQLRVPPVLTGSVSVPRTEGELDQFLAEVWRKETVDTPQEAASQYVSKVTELRAFFYSKMAEVARKEATYVSEMTAQDETTPLISADELSADPVLRATLLCTQAKYKFSELRLRLKEEVAQTILQLRARYMDTTRRRRTLRPKARRIMSEWFEKHLDHPYPSEAEKRLLAAQCEITMEQVTNWFSNKRCRSKGLKFARGRKKKQ